MTVPHDDLDALLQPFREKAMFEGCMLTSPESPGVWGDTPLHVAAFNNDVGVLTALMPFVRNIDVKGELGFTPLQNAVLHRSIESADYLISLGADLHCVNQMEESALAMMLACPAFLELLRRRKLVPIGMKPDAE